MGGSWPEAGSTPADSTPALCQGSTSVLWHTHTVSAPVYFPGQCGQLQCGQATHLSGTTTLTPEVFIIGAARRVAGAIGWTPLARRPADAVKSESMCGWEICRHWNHEGWQSTGTSRSYSIFSCSIDRKIEKRRCLSINLSLIAIDRLDTPAYYVECPCVSVVSGSSRLCVLHEYSPSKGILLHLVSRRSAVRQCGAQLFVRWFERVSTPR